MTIYLANWRENRDQEHYSADYMLGLLTVGEVYDSACCWHARVSGELVSEHGDEAAAREAVERDVNYKISTPYEI